MLIDAQDLVVQGDFGQIHVWAYDADPPDDEDDDPAEETLVDVDVPDGRLDIAGPPAHLRDQSVTTRIPPGRYRVRFWPRDRDAPAVLRKRWPGWEPVLRHRQADRATG